ncbi:hypothetical protein B0T14DRAFT_565528 [Immersiella caudata]|uniref:Uncharacterized protein n=1 Tax=Immersiella caudata TaxID=314043 RepID=A0AA39WZT1_9PEZI|nr:hypothetical protein B0T14DRAFT_565528 [Immersiella caudata]
MQLFAKYCCLLAALAIPVAGYTVEPPNHPLPSGPTFARQPTTSPAITSTSPEPTLTRPGADQPNPPETTVTTKPPWPEEGISVGRISGMSTTTTIDPTTNSSSTSSSTSSSSSSSSSTTSTTSSGPVTVTVTASPTTSSSTTSSSSGASSSSSSSSTSSSTSTTAAPSTVTLITTDKSTVTATVVSTASTSTSTSSSSSTSTSTSSTPSTTSTTSTSSTPTYTSTFTLTYAPSTVTSILKTTITETPSNLSTTTDSPISVPVPTSIPLDPPPTDGYDKSRFCPWCSRALNLTNATSYERTCHFFMQQPEPDASGGNAMSLPYAVLNWDFTKPLGMGMLKPDENVMFEIADPRAVQWSGNRLGTWMMGSRVIPPMLVFNEQTYKSSDERWKMYSNFVSGTQEIVNVHHLDFDCGGNLPWVLGGFGGRDEL